MKRIATAVAAGLLFASALFAGVSAHNSGASPDRCGTPFEAPGQHCPPTPTPEPAPTTSPGHR